jgi:hypothetical protein
MIIGIVLTSYTYLFLINWREDSEEQVFDSSPDSFRYLIMQAEVDITSASFILIGYRLWGLTLLFCESWGLLITSHTPNTTAGMTGTWYLSYLQNTAALLTTFLSAETGKPIL